MRTSSDGRARIFLKSMEGASPVISEGVFASVLLAFQLAELAPEARSRRKAATQVP